MKNEILNICIDYTAQSTGWA